MPCSADKYKGNTVRKIEVFVPSNFEVVIIILDTHNNGGSILYCKVFQA